MDNLDIIEQIGKHCDHKTHFNLCLASKEYYGYNKGVLYDLEKQNFVKSLQPMMIDFGYKITFHARLRQAHKVLRCVVKYKHLIRNPDFDKLRSVIKTKLVEFGDGGMSQRKVKYYMKTLDIF